MKTLRDLWERYIEVRLLTIAVLAALAWLALVRVADAATLNFSWTHPTTNTDGTTIPASGAGSLTGTRVQYGTCSGTAFGTMIAEQVVTAPAATASFANVGPGTYCGRAFARNTYGQESAASNVASRVVPPPVPEPPTVVTIALAAYEVRPTGNGIRLAEVGTIPLGSPCELQASGDLWFVDAALATLKSSYKGGAVVAKCG